jgi:beta-galactosidase
MTVLRLSSQPVTIERDFLALGDGGVGPSGTLAVNNRCIERDGRPWMPVMGEFHYSRCPADEWADELRRMRAGGVDIVATYVFWNHHEAAEGIFDWSGQRDLARFARLAHEAGLMFYLRPGPWVHAESRNGGLPDWLQARGNAGEIALRSNDERYLAHVRRFYGEIGQQLVGQLWRDGGPLVGVQLENEYDGRGPGRGAEHIAALKTIAQDSGLSVPIWTVTGWPTLDIPPREVLPVSGAYPDGFWGGSAGPQPPSGVFVFNTGRTIGEMGNVGGTPPEGPIDATHYPFFLAEAGGGMHVSYHRRVVLSTDDVAACALVQVGSGANLYGYYMYHGGTNPSRGLEETQATGYPNDVAELGYDFRAPQGQYGQLRPSYGRLRTLHSFMAAWGDELALMPTSVASDPDAADLHTLRVAARTQGGGGFVFVNNHCRHHPLPDFHGVQLRLELPDGGTQAVPSTPVDVPSGSYFIWPVNQRIGAARLRHASVQPLTRWTENGATTWVGFVLPGLAGELCFEADSVRALPHADAADGLLTLRVAPERSLPLVTTLTDADGVEHRIVLLSQAQADACSRQTIAGRERLLLCEAGLHVEGDTVVVLGQAAAEVRAWPADDFGGGDGFARWTREGAEPDALPVTLEVLADVQAPPAPRDGPLVAWRGRTVPLAPGDAAYEQGLRARLVPAAPCPPGARVLLQLDILGDAARLLADGQLVDDQFADGEPWFIGLHRFLRPDGSWPEFELRVVPADPGLPIFLETAARARLQAAAPRRAGVLAAGARILRRARLHFRSNEAPQWLD